MKELLTYIVQSLVEHPDEVSVTERKGDGETIFVGECYGSEGGDSDALGEYVGSYYGYVEMEMHHKDGEWRVCGIYTTLYMTNKTPAQTETGGNE